jgi:hypothetical protein
VRTATDERLADRREAEKELPDEQAADERLADILALADAIANRRAPLHFF